MNIFVLDKDPWKIPAHYCDLHVNKMLLETAQLLCSVFPEGEAPYKRTHYNHPCAVWARESIRNYKWLRQLGKALAYEFFLRTRKIHKSQVVIYDVSCAVVFNNRYVPDGPLTPWPQVMPDEYKEGFFSTFSLQNRGLLDLYKKEKIIKAYRRYYAAKLRDFRKRGICKFTSKKRNSQRGYYDK